MWKKTFRGAVLFGVHNINSPHGLDGACIKEQFVLLEIEKGLVYSTLILFCKCKLGCWNLMLDVECDFKTC